MSEGFEVLPILEAQNIFSKIPLKGCRSCGEPFHPNEIFHYEHSDGWVVKGFPKKQWLFCVCPICGYQWSLQKLGYGRDANETHAWIERVELWKKAYNEERSNKEQFRIYYHEHYAEMASLIHWDLGKDLPYLNQDLKGLWQQLNDLSGELSDDAMNDPIYQIIEALLAMPL